jgi:hypothetical protein
MKAGKDMHRPRPPDPGAMHVLFGGDVTIGWCILCNHAPYFSWKLGAGPAA